MRASSSPRQLEAEVGGEGFGVPWDPCAAWPGARRWVWLILAGLVCVLQGPGFLASLRPAREQGVDFFQDWASARNHLLGVPVYSGHSEAVERYLGYRVSHGGHEGVRVCFEVNAHPPAAVLVVLPLAAFDYPEATLTWNLVSLGALAGSLWLVAHTLRIPVSAWSLAPLITLLLISSPLRQQAMQGQFNLVLLWCVTATWAADRAGRPGWAGAWLGAATAVKLFPGFLLLYFAVKRQWKAVASAALALAALTGATAAVLGVDAFRSYVEDVLPRMGGLQSRWVNASLPGLWAKLFDPAEGPEPVTPLWRNPPLARAGAVVSCALVSVVVAGCARRAGSRREKDLAFGLAVTGMLLVSPVTWDHYFLLLLLPIAVVWLNLPPSAPARAAFMGLLVVLGAHPRWIWHAPASGGLLNGTASPGETLTLLSLQCYALLAFFMLTLTLARSRGARAVG